MRYEKHEINFKFEFVAEHRGAHFTIDGQHFMNNGEFIEAARKATAGYECKKDSSTRFDKGSDIEELKESVKSSEATLTSVKLGNDYDTIKKNFFDNVASSQFSWNVLNGNTLYTYIMNKNEFSEFMDNFSSYKKDRNVIRFKKHSSKIENWLMARV